MWKGLLRLLPTIFFIFTISYIFAPLYFICTTIMENLDTDEAIRESYYLYKFTFLLLVPPYCVVVVFADFETMSNRFREGLIYQLGFRPAKKVSQLPPELILGRKNHLRKLYARVKMTRFIGRFCPPSLFSPP